MNKKLSIISLLAMALFMIQCASSKKSMAGFEYTDSVNEIVQGKCYGCHSADGKSDKAKNALMWDNIPTMTASEQAHILDEILEVTSERAMPPKGMVERMPDKALTDQEVQVFQKWATEMKKRVSK
jgi:uncharacterized membrane protein